MQNLNVEASRFRDDLWRGIRDLSKKTDLIVLVHNLSHRIPRYSHPDAPRPIPALSLLLDEAKSLGIPWVLAITNKFSVSAHQHNEAINGVLKAYQASQSITSVINSCPYFIAGAAGAPVSWKNGETDSDTKVGTGKFVFAPTNLSWRPFQKKAAILPIEGVTSFCQLVHRVLRDDEEAAFQVCLKLFFFLPFCFSLFHTRVSRLLPHLCFIWTILRNLQGIGFLRNWHGSVQ